MKISICIIFSIAAAAIHAQTLSDPISPEEDFASVLDPLVPAVTVINEDEQKEQEDDNKEAEEVDKDISKTADDGIQIQVEKIAGQSGILNKKGKVKIDSPWPAKPISVPPTGWKFAPGEKDTEPFRAKVELASGNTVDLSIIPYVLVPIADGRTAIKISEPGYQAALQFAQKNTLGVMLQNSTSEIEHHEKHAAEAIQRLQQLLSSLPRTEK